MTLEHKRQRFERLLKPEFDALYRTARRVVGHAALAEEVVQDACLKAFAHFDLASEPRGFRPWLYKILMNQAIDTRRRTQRERRHSDCTVMVADVQLADPGALPHDEITRRETGRALDAAVASLPDDLRALVVLVLIEEMSYGEAAACLGITEDLVRSRLSRARKQLRATLATKSERPPVDGLVTLQASPPAHKRDRP